MAQGKQKKQRKETRSAEELGLQKQIDALAEKEKRSEAENKTLKDLRSKVAPMRFERLANQRVPRALAVIAGIGKLSGSGYTFTEEQAKEIVSALQGAVEAVALKFSGTKETASGFKLGSKK